MSLLLAAFACSGHHQDGHHHADDGGTDTADTETTTPWSTVKPPPEGEPALYFKGSHPTNVLMISIDTTRRDQFAPWSKDGSNYTPFLSSLATNGFRLDDHIQCSDWTFHSTSCTLNGQYSEENGFIPRLQFKPDDPANHMPDGQQTLAQRLQDAGYYTIMVSGNGWLGPADNNDQGYIEAPPPSSGNATHIMEDAKARLDAARANGATKWLLHMHFLEPHPPYIPPDEYLDEEKALPPLPDWIDLTSQSGQYAATGQWPAMSPSDQANLEAHLWARYHGELRYLDDQIAAYWPNWEASGMLDDTLVVLWTDHGEQMWEHGNQSHAWFLASEENDGVAFFWAKNLPPVDWTQPTHSVDLVPTILDAVGLTPDPDDDKLSGYIIGTAPQDRPRFSTSVARLGPEQAVTLDNWKLVFNYAGKLHLYDRSVDRYELNDLYVTSPDDPHVLQLWNLLLPRIHMLHALVPDKPLIYPEGLPTE